MSYGLSLRWRLMAWVSGALLVVFALTFLVVYEQTGSRLRDQVDDDVRGDLGQLMETARSFGGGSAAQLAGRLRTYVQAQPFLGTSSLLFAVVPGHGTVSNHPQLFAGTRPGIGASAGRRSGEQSQGRALLREPPGLRTVSAPDVGDIRIGERAVELDGVHVRLGAGESLLSVTRAQHGVARAFIAAGLLALLLVLVASYLAGAAIARPLRRLSRVAGRVDDGDLHPRVEVSPSSGQEIRVLAESFNHMLDRLAAAFEQQRAFVADASHELRTPLTVIGGQLEVLAAQDAPSETDVRRVQRLVAAEVGRMSRLVDDLLLLTRAEQADFLRVEQIPIARFVEDLWRATLLGRDRRCVLGPIPDGVLVADPDRLAQALRNLIVNAIQHTDAPNGLVRLQTELHGESVRFIVLDDGPGIPAAERDRVFERFRRTDSARDRAGGGTGLGLAIVRAIAVAHGGAARAIAAETGSGARLQLEIPGLQPAKADRQTS